MKGGGGRGPLLEAFLDRYFGPIELSPAPPEDFAERAEAYTGEFRGNRFAHTTLAKLGALAGSFKVAVNEEGELLALNNRYVETSPRVFTERNGESTLVFIEGDDGRMSHFYSAQFPIVTFERVPATEARDLHLALMVAASLVFLGTVLAWPAGWAVRKWFGVRKEGTPRIPSAARLVLWATAALLLALVIGIAASLSDPTDIAFGELGKIKAVLTLPLIALLPAVLAIAAMVRVWRRRLGTRTGRVLYTVVVLLTVLFYWQLSVWNVLGFRL